MNKTRMQKKQERQQALVPIGFLVLLAVWLGWML